ncbi:hypothetical protein [Campylobacter lanienae]|uniref:hypothetical protein n=1 Tax=Campylobacter lanienae TaxID=75658 RepID=UPI000BB4370A|nr:hypothetical protein [Campylobacter lanienae]
MKDKKSVIHSIRISKSLKEFLNSLDNANEFIKELLVNTDDYKNFLHKKEILENQPSLFDEMKKE